MLVHPMRQESATQCCLSKETVTNRQFLSTFSELPVGRSYTANPCGGRAGILGEAPVVQV